MRNTLLKPEDSLLLIIDIQEKLLTVQNEKEKIQKNAATLTEAAKALDIQVVVSEQYPQGLGPTIADIKDRLPENTKFYEKKNFSCCVDEDFNKLIESLEKKQILICGMESHICVHQTAYDLIQLGYDVHVIMDALSSRKDYECKVGIERMISYGAIPSCTEMALFEWLKCSSHPEFKTVQKLIK